MTRVLAVLLCAGTAAAHVEAATVTQPYLGITRVTDTLQLAAPTDQSPGFTLGAHVAKINLVSIDLHATGIGFKVSPDNGPDSGEARTQRTLDFMNQEHAQLAINTHFFNFTTNTSVNTTITGFAASNGTVYSNFEPAPLANALLPYALTADSPALNISATNVASIVHVGATQNTLAGGNVPYNAVSGSAQIITNGVKSLPVVVDTVTGPGQVVTKAVPPFGGAPLGNWYTDQIAARTAIGLSADNGTLYLFTADAAGGSAGMTVSEVADYLLRQHVYNVLNLDGGGSTTLAMADPLTHIGQVVNVASGGPRFVASSLAVFAAPVPVPASLPLMMAASLVLACAMRRRTS